MNGTWGGSWECFLEEDACLPSLIELHHIRDPGVYVFDTAYCLASSHHLLKCNRANFCAAFLSPLASHPPPSTSPLLPAACYRSLISLLSYTLFLMHSVVLSPSFYLPSIPISSILFSFTHSHIAAHPPSTFSLSVLTPWGKWSYVNCFLLDVHPACYLSILMNSFPPFTPKS